MSHLLVIGTASIDTKGRATRPIRPGTSTPGAIRVSVGGVARNIAENLARLGEHVVLLSAVGDDGSGRRILQQATDCHIDVSQILVASGHRTAAYIAVLDEEGKPAVSIDDMSISRKALTPDYIHRRRALFRDALLVIIDANLSPRTIATIFRLARRYDIPVCADPTSVTFAPRIKPYLADLTLITPNGAEAEALCGVPVADRTSAVTAAQALVGLGVQIAIVTLGATGLVYATSKESGHIPALQSEVVDLTGAGDALTAAVIMALLNDIPIDEAVRLGTSAAALTLQCRETVCPSLSLERLYDQMVI